MGPTAWWACWSLKFGKRAERAKSPWAGHDAKAARQEMDNELEDERSRRRG